VGIVQEVRVIEVIEKPVTGDLPVNQQIEREEKEGHNGFQSAGEDCLFLAVAFGIRIWAQHWRTSKKVAQLGSLGRNSLILCTLEGSSLPSLLRLNWEILRALLSGPGDRWD
jgi:hypothetical protein